MSVFTVDGGPLGRFQGPVQVYAVINELENWLSREVMTFAHDTIMWLLKERGHMIRTEERPSETQ